MLLGLYRRCRIGLLKRVLVLIGAEVRCQVGGWAYPSPFCRSIVCASVRGFMESGVFCSVCSCSVCSLGICAVVSLEMGGHVVGVLAGRVLVLGVAFLLGLVQRRDVEWLLR